MSIFGSPTTVGGGARSAATVVTGSTISTSVGDLILVGVGWSDSGTCTGVMDVAGNSFTAGTQHNGAAGSFFQWFWCNVATMSSAINAFTASFSNPTNNNTVIFVWDIPLTGAASFDVDVASDGGTDKTTAVYSTAGSDEFVAVMAYDQAGGGGYAAQTSPMYTLDSSSFGTFGGAEHIVFASAQTNIQSTFSAGSSGSAAFALAFYASGGGGGNLIAAITGQGALSASTGAFNLAAVMAGHGTVAGALFGKGALAAVVAGHGAVVAGGLGLSLIEDSMEGTSVVEADLGGIGVLASAMLGHGILHGTLSTPYALNSNMLGRGSVVAFPTLPPSKTYLPPNNPKGRQSPPYVLKDFGVSLQAPAYLSTSSNALQLFHQTSYVPRVNAGSVLPPTWSTPGTPDNFNYQGRVQAPGELLVAPGNGSLSWKIYKVVAQGMIFTPSSAVNPSFNFVLNQNYFAFDQSQVSDNLFVMAQPIPLTPGTMVGFTLFDTLSGNGPGNGALGSGGVLWVGGTQYFGNGFSNRLVGREPQIQLSLGLQFNGTIFGR